MIAPCAVVCLVLVAFSVATEVSQCPGRSFNNLQSDVELLKCNKPPCKLKKGKSQVISIAFTPNSDVTDVKNHVNAVLAGVPLPFIGVDGVSICDKIYLENGEKASCPVIANTKYIYKDSFPIHSFYPSVTVTVHWELVGDNGNSLSCYEVLARIQ